MKLRTTAGKAIALLVMATVAVGVSAQIKQECGGLLIIDAQDGAMFEIKLLSN